MTMWYLRIRTPTGDEIHLYEIGIAVDPNPLVEQHLDRIRAELGIPEGWIDAGWDISLLDAPLHPKLLEIAILHPLETP
ncbi:hypothetical protein GA0074692_6859 [Micromonospora pallida]|uniref:Uncharacterized protein n=1 Tax=Micromonospora pallida TaxID=145854 RepID=A0A1C6TPA3_9ACTN|nr:hypothetical protein [Micromonospora pallida]SCL43393.1 hypothetical protein GA0074692_6859 [Micromonospora pallida]